MESTGVQGQISLKKKLRKKVKKGFKKVSAILTVFRPDYFLFCWVMWIALLNFDLYLFHLGGRYEDWFQKPLK